MANDIHCMLIPLQEHFLLLPNPMIIEVTPLPTIETADSTKNYLLGKYIWQDQTINVIDLESMIAIKKEGILGANKLCILSGINPDINIPFYALPCFGSPQLISIKESSLQFSHDIDDSDFIYCQIKVGNKVAFIPHLDNIEAELAN